MKNLLEHGNTESLKVRVESLNLVLKTSPRAVKVSMLLRKDIIILVSMILMKKASACLVHLHHSLH